MNTSLLRLRRPQPAGPDAAAEEQAPAVAPALGLQSQWTGGSALATRAASGVLWAGLAAGPVALLLALSGSFGSAPVTGRPVAPVVDRSGEQAQASEFAGRLVGLWLTSVRGQEGQLAPLLHDVAVSLPTVGWSTGPMSVADVRRLADGTWTVVTAVAVKPAPASADTPATSTSTSTSTSGSAAWPVRYFQVSVHLDAGGPVALALPAPVAAPGVADRAPRLDYRYRAVQDDPIGVSASQFLAALLTGAGDVTRYLSPGTTVSAITPAPYTAVAVTDIATDRELAPGAAVPADGTHLRALVTATATAAPQQQATVQYALTLTVRGGRWEITALDPAPALQPLIPSRAGSSTASSNGSSGAGSDPPAGAAPSTTSRPAAPTQTSTPSLPAPSRTLLD